MTSLLLSRLSAQFGRVLLQEKVMEKLTSILRHFQEEEPGNGEDAGAGNGREKGDAFARLSALISGTEKERDKFKTQELLTRQDELVYGRVLSLLEGYREALLRREADLRSGADAWDFLREQFGADSDRYEDAFDQAAAMLEHGFDFMEAAFGSGQEMVIFLTELNSNYYCAAFLKEYDCQRYYEYNKQLLFDEEEQLIRQQIRRT